MLLSVILLAAGLSKRMGDDKLLMSYNGIPLLQVAVDLLGSIEAHEKIIVTTGKRLKHVTLPQGIRAVINKNRSKGISSSIHLGALNAAGTHFMFMAADQPKLRASDITQIIKTSKENPDKIVYPVISNKPCLPSIFPECLKNELLTITGDIGGRSIREKHPELAVPVIPACPENFIDIDTPKELYDISQH